MFSRGFLLTFTFHCYREGAISNVYGSKFHQLRPTRESWSGFFAGRRSSDPTVASSSLIWHICANQCCLIFPNVVRGKQHCNKKRTWIYNPQLNIYLSWATICPWTSQKKNKVPDVFCCLLTQKHLPSKSDSYLYISLKLTARPWKSPSFLVNAIKMVDFPAYVSWSRSV